jgi:uncharacterized protein with HEPN domain
MPRDAASISDMLEFARNVLAFTEGLDEQGFAANAVVQSAVLHQLTLIGEAVRRVSQPTRLAYPDVPWLRISNLRNILVHDYDDIDLLRIWTRDIPALIAMIEPIVNAIEHKPRHADPE